MAMRSQPGLNEAEPGAPVRLQLIVGSTRHERRADAVLAWVRKRMSEHAGLSLDVLDLREWPLPFFAEHSGTVGDRNDPTYSDPIVKQWNRHIALGEAYLIVTPEYNRSYPAVLKNALDYVWLSYALRNKPLGIVGYGNTRVGGARAAEQLALVAIEQELVPLRNTVLLSRISSLFDADGSPTDPTLDRALDVLLQDLLWWGLALRNARRQGELKPASARFAQ